MGEIYKAHTTEREAEMLEFMRSEIAKKFGVTLIGNRLTLRWTMPDGEYADAHMVIINVRADSEIGEEWNDGG